MVTSRDVARAAGVSQATVSRVLSASSLVSAETRERVIAVIREIGYVPDLAARTMKTRRTGTVGVVVADLTNPFYPQMLGALNRAFDAVGYRVTIWVADGAMDNAALRAIRQRSVDGVVFTTATEESAELRGALTQGSPVVLVNRTVRNLACDQVGTDSLRGGSLVGRYLLDRGRADAAFIGGTPLASTSQMRLQGFSDALQIGGRPLGSDRILHGEYTRASGYGAMLRILDGGPRIDAVFCANDLLAFGALDAARSYGLRVPDDVWVIGYDDVEMSSWEAFSLTTVRQDIEAMARIAAEMLIERIGEPGMSPRSIDLAPTFVERGSTGAPIGSGRRQTRAGDRHVGDPVANRWTT